MTRSRLLVLAAAAPLLLLPAPGVAAGKATVLVEDQAGDANGSESRRDPMLQDRATEPASVAGADVRELTMKVRGHVLEIRLRLQGAPVRRVGYDVLAVDDKGCDVLFTLRPSTDASAPVAVRTCNDVAQGPAVRLFSARVEDSTLVQRISLSALPGGLRGRALTQFEVSTYSTAEHQETRYEVSRWDVGRGSRAFRIR